MFKADPIGNKLGMDHKTVKSYVGLLRQMHLVHQLPGWRPGLGARESMTPKMYLSDVGLLCHLLGADARRLLADDQVKGKACETFVVNEVLEQASWADVETRAHHYQRRDEDIDDDPQSLEPMLAMHERDRANGLLDAPWPPVYPKMPDEPPRVAPSRARKEP